MEWYLIFGRGRNESYDRNCKGCSHQDEFEECSVPGKPGGMLKTPKQPNLAQNPIYRGRPELNQLVFSLVERLALFLKLLGELCLASRNR